MKIQIFKRWVWLVCLGFCCEGWVAAESPMYFFYNIAIEQNAGNMAEQLQLAKSHDVETVAFHIGMPWAITPGDKKLEHSDSLFQQIKAVNPTAAFIPRCFMSPSPAYRKKYSDEFPFMPGVDVSGESHASLGSDFLFDETGKSLRTVVRHYENSEFGESIPAYYLAAQETGEWIPFQYRNGGADRSRSNADKFREWLGRKYATEAALQTAWGDEDVTFETAMIPADETGRFPMKGTSKGETVRMFYRLPQEQDWVDYSTYMSDMTVQRISDLAEIVHEETGGKKKSLVFYGYVYELPGSMNGHFGMGRLLRNPDLQMLGAPMSYVNYTDRLSGGPGGCMSALDSLPLHGKKWLSEIDVATYAQKDDAYVPSWYWDSSVPLFDIPKTKESACDILNRIFAFSCAHRSTLWWMDLFGAGWYSDSALWDTLDQGMGRHFVDLSGAERTYRPDVAVIVDEKSRLYENCTWSGFFEIYPQLRNQAMLTGASTGFYYLDDFMEGRVPASKVCLFVNLWRMESEQLGRIHDILRRNKSAAIWQYAPGWMSGGCAGIELAAGMQTEADSGGCVSAGEGLLSGLSWGPVYNIEPRIDINKKGVNVLARYADGQISAAYKEQDGIAHYFLCSPGMSTDVLRRIYAKEGVHLWCSPKGVINTDGETFVHLHASQNADYQISIPAIGTDRGRTKRFSLKKGESIFIKLTGE